MDLAKPFKLLRTCKPRLLGGKSVVWTEQCPYNKMSKYYESLEGKAKERYKRKLELAGFNVQNDPYAPVNQEKFKGDMVAWPALARVWPHFWLFYQATWSLYSRTAFLMEATGCLQIFPERVCPYSVHSEAEKLLFRIEGPSQRIPDKAQAARAPCITRES